MTLATDRKEGNVFITVCHSVHSCTGREKAPWTESNPNPEQRSLWTETPGQRPPGQRPTLYREPSWTENPLCTENPWYRHPVVATAAVGTHPTGMHSCYQLKFFCSSRNTLRLF